MSSNLQEERSKIDNEIVSAVIDSTPEEYFDFELLLTYQKKENQELGNVLHVLTCLDGDGLTITPSTEVFNAVRKLSLMLNGHSIKWEKIKYHIYCDDADNWRFEADFIYGDEAPKVGDTIQ